MKAILVEDRISSLDLKYGVEIGIIPRGVGIERLRWDGSQLIDLIDLDEMWVRYLSPGFELHAVEVPNSQLVSMNYRDRKNLIIENNIIRVSTIEELQNNERIKLNMMRDSKRLSLVKIFMLTIIQLLYIVIVYVRTNNSTLESFLDDLVPDIRDTFEFSEVKDDIADNIRKLKNLMDNT